MKFFFEIWWYKSVDLVPFFPSPLAFMVFNLLQSSLNTQGRFCFVLFCYCRHSIMHQVFQGSKWFALFTLSSYGSLNCSSVLQEEISLKISQNVIKVILWLLYSFNTVTLNLLVVILLKFAYQLSCISDIYIKVYNNNKITVMN